jgi:ABC-type sugar transport system substrate-binding protein
VLQNYTNPAIKDIGLAAVDEARKFPNVKVTDQDSQNLQDQVAKAETFISQKVDALGLEPWEGAAIFPTLRKAKDAKIPVLMVQDDAPGAVPQGLAITYIASDEEEGGRLVGVWLLKQLKGQGKVAIIEGAPGDSPAIARSKGFLKAVSGTGLKIVVRQTANWARDQGLRVATDILTANPDLNAIFAHNDEMAFGALQAIRAAGKAGKVILVGYNGTCIGIEAAAKGQFQAEGILFLDRVGREFVRQAVQHLNGKNVPPRVTPPIMVLDTQDMAGILQGKKAADQDLKERIRKAAGGKCQ